VSASGEHNNGAPADVHVGAGCGWPAALVGLAVLVSLFDWFRAWLNDADDARLDRLRETAVEVCAERTESVQALGDCVESTIEAAGQPS